MTGAALLLAAVADMGLAGASSPAPSVFDVEVDAAPMVVSMSVPAAVPLGVDAGVARSSVAINSQPNAVSQAAVVYTPLLEAAPALFGLPSPPGQALPYCYSYFPGDPREAACGGPAQNAGIFDVGGGSGHTKTAGDAADPTTLRSESSVNAAQVSGTGSMPAPVMIGAVASAARAGADDHGRMAAGASTAITDLDVAGILHVSSLRTEVTGALGGLPGSSAHQESTTLSGVTVAGQPATIDNDGVHAAGQTLGGQVIGAQQPIDDALSSAGISVRTVPAAAPNVTSDGTGAELSSGGLVISLAEQGQVAVQLRLGVSHIIMSAHRADATSGAEGGSAFGGGDGPVATASPVAGSVSASASDVSSPTPPPQAPAPGVGSPPPSAAPFQRRVLARDMVAASWHVPYAPLAFLVLAAPLLAQLRRLSLTRR
jgi:hypothetical protein